MKLSFPPVITFICLIAQFILLSTIPIPIAINLVLGLLVLSSSLAIIIFSFMELNKFETTYVPDGDPEKLVQTGPFRYSRNPIYLGMLGILISVCFFSQSYLLLSFPLCFFHY